MGLVGEACTADELDGRLDTLLKQITTIPSNQLFFQKMVINNAVEMQVRP
jgi:enoyl-CoA hydratase